MQKYPTVVKDNLIFRANILLNPELQPPALEMCRIDPLFFMNVGLNIFEPRDTKMPHKPFITWEFQDRAVLSIKESIENGHDIAIEKSRDMGATWLVIAVLLWFWRFSTGFEAIVGSRKEDLVDNFQKDSLFGKFDYYIKSMPKWLLPNGWGGNRDRLFLKLNNPENDNTILGESSNKDFAVGGRYKVIMLDEFALWQEDNSVWRGTADASPCRIPMSTPRGLGNQYADIIHGKDGIIVPKLRFHWTEHPNKNPGMYTSSGKKLKILDKTYEFPEDYTYILDGKIRSPWYDQECKRRSPLQMAQEVDIDYLQSGTPVFRKEDLNLLGKYAEPDSERRYAVGVDPSEGNFDPASIVVLDDMGVEVHHLTGFFPLDVIAIKCVEIAKKYNNALLAIENNSMGMAVIGKVKETYDNLYYQKNYNSNFDKTTDTIGWRTTVATKPKLIQELEEALREQYILLSTKETVDECLHYQYNEKASTNRVSMGAAEGYHDDRVMATAIALQALKEIRHFYNACSNTDQAVCEKKPVLTYNPITGEKRKTPEKSRPLPAK